MPTPPRLIFKSKEGRSSKRRAQPSEACVGGLGLVETPPAKRLESPSSPPSTSAFCRHPKKPKGASTQGAALWFKASTPPTPLPYVSVNPPAAFPRSLAHVERWRWQLCCCGFACSLLLAHPRQRGGNTGWRSSLLCQLPPFPQRFLPPAHVVPLTLQK